MESRCYTNRSVITRWDIVGTCAAKVAVGIGASVILFDVNINRLRYLNDALPKNITLLFSNQYSLEDEIKKCRCCIGAVLIPDAEALKLVTEEMIKKTKPNSVIVNVVIDQDGCIKSV